jgi:hypothetical protein
MTIIQTETLIFHRAGRTHREYRIHCDLHADGKMTVRTACGRLNNAKAEAVWVRQDSSIVALDAITKISKRVQGNGYRMVGRMEEAYSGPSQGGRTPATQPQPSNPCFVQSGQATLIAALAAGGAARRRTFSVAL